MRPLSKAVFIAGLAACEPDKGDTSDTGMNCDDCNENAQECWSYARERAEECDAIPTTSEDEKDACDRAAAEIATQCDDTYWSCLQTIKDSTGLECPSFGVE